LTGLNLSVIISIRQIDNPRHKFFECFGIVNLTLYLVNYIA